MGLSTEQRPSKEGGGRAASRRRTIPCELTQLPAVRRYVDEVASASLLTREQIYALKVAASEACANAMEHGRNGSHPLVLSARQEAGRLTLDITSRGDFRIDRGEDPDPGRDRGWGLSLMVALTDEVRVRRLAGGGLQVSLSLDARALGE